MGVQRVISLNRGGTPVKPPKYYRLQEAYMVTLNFCKYPYAYISVSLNGEPQCRPQSTVHLIIGTAKQGPLTAGTPELPKMRDSQGFFLSVVSRE